MHSRSLLMASALAAALVSRPGLAADDKGQAAQLLAEGKKLMLSHDYAAACPKLAQSESLAASSTTSLTLGSCYEKTGNLTAAAEAYRTAESEATAAHQKPRIAAAKKALASVEGRTAHLTIHAATDVAGLDVRLDGDRLEPSELNEAIARPAGGHDVEARAPGKKTWQTHVELKAGDRAASVDVPALEDDTKAPSAEADAKSPASDTAAPSTDEGDGARNTQHIVGIAVAGVGVVGLAVGVIAGLNAGSTTDDLKQACGSGPTCSASNGSSLHDSATNLATESTIAFVAGGALVAAGAVIYFTAPQPKGASPAVGLAPAPFGSGLSLVGIF